MKFNCAEQWDDCDTELDKSDIYDDIEGDVNITFRLQLLWYSLSGHQGMLGVYFVKFHIIWLTSMITDQNGILVITVGDLQPCRRES